MVDNLVFYDNVGINLKEAKLTVHAPFKTESYRKYSKKKKGTNFHRASEIQRSYYTFIKPKLEVILLNLLIEGKSKKI